MQNMQYQENLQQMDINNTFKNAKKGVIAMERNDYGRQDAF